MDSIIYKVAQGQKMDPKKEVVKSQKKFRHFKDDNPIYFVETFDHNGKTHYVMSTSSFLYIGYLEKATFNQIINYNVGTYVTSYCVLQDTLFFGLKNGNIIFLSLQKAYNEIFYNKVESVDGASIIGICVTVKEKRKQIYTVSQNNSIKLYEQVEENFKLSKTVQIDSKILKVVSKNISPDLKHPIFMICSKEFQDYPALLTVEEIDSLLQKQTSFTSLLKLRQKTYFEDQRLFSTLTSMDFNPKKMIAALGYIDGSIQILKIEKASEGSNFYVMNPELRVQQRENVVSVSIMNDSDCPYIAFVTESNFSGVNYEKRSAPFAKIKIEKGKEITAARWTNNKFFIAAAISSEDKKRVPKMYCIEQDVVDEA